MSFDDAVAWAERTIVPDDYAGVRMGVSELGMEQALNVALRHVECSDSDRERVRRIFEGIVANG